MDCSGLLAIICPHVYNFLQEHLHNKYNAYAIWFFVCEQLNFIVVLSMWFITNKFLKYQVIQQERRVNHLL